MGRPICAFDNGNSCLVLNEKTCSGCTFYKTEEQLNEGRKKVDRLLKRLPPEQQRHYDEKYHNTRTRKY